ncbi:MAG: von Willebrand factor type A domain-containing protein [Planctomycetota bacterium]
MHVRLLIALLLLIGFGCNDAPSGATGGATGGAVIGGLLGHHAGGPAIGAAIGSYEPPPTSREEYDHLPEADFRAVADAPLSTFSLDVDTASYANARRMISSGNLPPAGAVRIEEFVNYFPYDYVEPASGETFAASLAVADCPWNSANKLIRIGLRAKSIDPGKRPPANLVFLVDVSGSMGSANKLPLVQQALLNMLPELGPDDTVSIVTYAGSSGVALAPTCGHETRTIKNAIKRLTSGGSTNGAAGINTAYQLAAEYHKPHGINRVMLCTDGDFNVGVTDRDSLTRMLEDHAAKGTYLTILGFGMGNYRDGTLEYLSNKGDGNYAYIDTKDEAEKVLGDQLMGTLVTVAKDAKIQVEFNPAEVAAYRLIGYENRALKDEEFNDDRKDAGDVGAGHTVTALYEIVPVGGTSAGSDAEIARLNASIEKLQNVLATVDMTPDATAAVAEQIAELQAKRAALRENAGEPGVDPLVFQTDRDLTDRAKSGELLRVKLRYKEPDAAKEPGTSRLKTWSIADGDTPFEKADDDFGLAVSAAAFGMLLRESEHVGDLDYDWVLQTAKRSGSGGKYCGDFVDLVRDAKSLGKSE